MKHAAVFACWVACGARMWLTFIRGPRPIWRVSLTLSLLFVTISTTARYEPWLFSGSPGLEEAASYFWLLLGMGMVNVYVDSLEQPTPRWKSSGHYLVLGYGFAVVALVAWGFIPQGFQSGELTSAAMTPALAVFILASYAPLVPTLARISRYCVTRLRSQPSATAPGERVGLAFIGFFCGAGTLSFGATTLDVFIRLPSHAARPAGHPLVVLTPIVNAISLCGLSIGLCFFLAGPPIAARRQRMQAERIRPLWAHLIKRHPDVHLASHYEAHALTRMTIEVHDALSLCHLPGSTPPTAEAISRALLANRYDRSARPGTVSAAHLVTTGRLTEVDLADAYNSARNGDIACM